MIEKEIIRIDLSKKGLLEKYVILKKDKEGYYIEYAFTEGAPHDNRCLSWYDSYQENAYIRNGWTKNCPTEENKKVILAKVKEKIDAKLGKVFRLISFTCGYEEDPEGALETSEESWKEYHPQLPFIPEDHICRVGKPSKKCISSKCVSNGWTYKEPVKCACWGLTDGTEMEDFIKNYKISIRVTDLIKLSSVDQLNIVNIL